jgi:N-acetylmuramoyl-L-alanine amidase
MRIEEAAMTRQVEVRSGDTLSTIANREGVSISDMRVNHAGRTYDLSKPSYDGLDPRALQAGDIITLPGSQKDNDQDAAAKSKTLADSIQQDSEDSGGIGKTVQECPKAVIVLDPGHGGESYKDNLQGSSWTNAIACVSDTLEKSMTQRLCAKIKVRLDSPLFQSSGVKKGYTKIETHLTKTDENVNLSGKDRAGVAKDKRADIFLIIHFNSYDDTSFFETTARRYSWEQTHILDLSTGIANKQRDKPSGFRRRYYSRASGKRGPQMVFRSGLGEKVESAAKAISKDIEERVGKYLRRAQPNISLTNNPDVTSNVAVMSPTHLGLKKEGAKQIVPVYLEADYINVESGDRLWNPTSYQASLKSVLDDLGRETDDDGDTPNVDKEGASGSTQEVAASTGEAVSGETDGAIAAPEESRSEPTDFSDIAALVIAWALIDNLKHRIPLDQ